MCSEAQELKRLEWFIRKRTGRVDSEQDRERRRALRQQRAIATGLLLVMAAVFIATRLIADPPFWVRLVQAGAEAALVGGFADWFAVTALFRRPLGLPIPHTALIPRKKDQLGAGLASFVERNFLAPDVVVAKLRSLDLIATAARWTARRENADAVAERVVAALPVVVNSLRDRELKRLFRRVLHSQLQRVDVAPILGMVLRLLTQTRQHHLLFDRALGILHQLLDEYQERIYEMVGERSRWWIPRSVDRKVAQAIVSGMLEFLAELKDESHPARHRFDAALAELAHRLEHSPETRDWIEGLKTQLLADATVQDYLGSIWDEVRVLILHDITSPGSRTKRALAGALATFGRSVSEDAAIRERLNARFETMVTKLVVPWRREIGALITEVVHQWDAATVTERLELEVGRDLQFIRINGTIVGALVGCSIFLLSALLS